MSLDDLIIRFSAIVALMDYTKSIRNERACLDVNKLVYRLIYLEVKDNRL